MEWNALFFVQQNAAQASCNVGVEEMGMDVNIQDIAYPFIKVTQTTMEMNVQHHVLPNVMMMKFIALGEAIQMVVLSQRFVSERNILAMLMVCLVQKIVQSHVLLVTWSAL